MGVTVLVMKLRREAAGPGFRGTTLSGRVLQGGQFLLFTDGERLNDGGVHLHRVSLSSPPWSESLVFGDGEGHFIASQGRGTGRMKTRGADSPSSGRRARRGQLRTAASLGRSALTPCSSSRVVPVALFVPLNTTALSFSFSSFPRDACAAPGPAGAGTSDRSPEPPASRPQHRKAAWSGEAKRRPKHR